MTIIMLKIMMMIVKMIILILMISRRRMPTTAITRRSIEAKLYLCHDGSVGSILKGNHALIMSPNQRQSRPQKLHSQQSSWENASIKKPGITRGFPGNLSSRPVWTSSTGRYSSDIWCHSGRLSRQWYLRVVVKQRQIFNLMCNNFQSRLSKRHWKRNSPTPMRVNYKVLLSPRQAFPNAELLVVCFWVLVNRDHLIEWSCYIDKLICNLSKSVTIASYSVDCCEVNRRVCVGVNKRVWQYKVGIHPAGLCAQYRMAEVVRKTWNEFFALNGF